MATVNEKLEAMLDKMMPELDQSIGEQPFTVRMALEALRPTLERKIDEHLARAPEELDDALALAIDILGRLRSDDARELIVSPAGGAYYAAVVDDSDEHAEEFFHWRVVDPVRPAVDGAGPDEVREVDGGASGVPHDSGAALDHRPV